MPIQLEDLNLRTAERTLCETALQKAGSIIEAAQLLGITRHALKRRMVKHHIEWPTVLVPSSVVTPSVIVPSLSGDPLGAFSSMRADG